MSEAQVKAPPRRRKARATGPTTPDPIEIAMASESADAAPESPAQVLLRKQARLIEQQAAAIDAQSRLAAADLTHRRWQIFSERMSVVLKVLTGMVGAAFAVALGLMVWTASRADGLVVEAFTTPPEMAARGVTGELVAGRVLDRLAGLTAASDSGRPASSFAADWSRDFRIEIPQTSISVGELYRSLKLWLGHETRVSGTVYRTATGVTVVLRTGRGSAVSASGPEAELEAVTDRAAEALFARTQPYRWGVLLATQGRRDEALRVFDRLIATAGPRERAWALIRKATLVAGSQGLPQARALLLEAARLDPGNSVVYQTLAAFEAQLGHPQKARDYARRGIELLERSDRGVTPAVRRQRLTLLRSQVASFEGDHAAAAALYARLKDVRVVGVNNNFDVFYALSAVAAHDLPAARQALADADSPFPPPPPVGFAAVAEAMGDWSRTEAVLAAVSASAPRGSRVAPNQARRAVALARLGRFAEANALIGGTPLDCQPCVVARGEIAGLQRRPKIADHWFGEAVGMAPEYPLTHLAWARAKLSRGDGLGAAEQAMAAHKKGPRSPDALHLLGVAFLAQDKLAAAERQLRRAAELAPRWGANRLRLAQALARQGKRGEAKEELARAVRQDLAMAEAIEAQALARSLAP